MMNAIRAVQGNLRGQFLWLMALIYSLIGYSLLVDVENTSRQRFFDWLPSFVPDGSLGVLWLSAACVALVAGLRRDSDKIGFTALMVPSSFWAVAYLCAWVEDIGSPVWVGSVVYGALAAINWLVSGWPNPVEVNRGNRR